MKPVKKTFYEESRDYSILHKALQSSFSKWPGEGYYFSLFYSSTDTNYLYNKGLMSFERVIEKGGVPSEEVNKLAEKLKIEYNFWKKQLNLSKAYQKAGGKIRYQNVYGNVYGAFWTNRDVDHRLTTLTGIGIDNHADVFVVLIPIACSSEIYNEAELNRWMLKTERLLAHWKQRYSKAPANKLVS